MVSILKSNVRNLLNLGMEKKWTFFLSAGEASGDLHGARLMESLRRKVGGECEFVFLGGDEMAAVAGHEPVVDYRRMAYMGFAEVIRNLGNVFRNLGMARKAMNAQPVDALILIDYPSFNFRLARTAQKLGIPVYYYIPPKVWAWKKWRVRQMRRWCRKVLSIFPFEVDFFRRRGLDCEFVGNPTAAEVAEKRRALPPAQELMERAGLHPGDRYIALVPGSRHGEIRANLPAMLEAAARYPQYKVIVAGAPGIDKAFYDEVAPGAPVLSGETFAIMAYAEAALVTSGTATLECALLGTPLVVCYRGKRITYEIMRHVLTIPFISLPNLVAGREIVKELIMHFATPEAMAAELGDILPGGKMRGQRLEEYAALRDSLMADDGAAADRIVSDILAKP